jgi:hypothetical protein
MGFKLKGINTVLNMFLFIQYYALQMPTPRKVVGFFFHRTVSHPLLSWLMHEPILQVIFPWNFHASKNILLQFNFCYEEKDVE